MAKKPQSTSVQQTAIGNDNIQVVGSNNVITRISNFFAGDTKAQRAIRNRKAMLELVKNTWIKGVLEKSLYNEVLIDLGMEERPGAVDHPWEMQVRMPNQTNRILPPGTSMIEVFDEMNGAMLVLGEPGSGKTTMLLELARDCIGRARQDSTFFIPVVFNLSSWPGPKQPIIQWLIEELIFKYYISKKIAREWVENDELLLLLDGLDEVKTEYREECVKAINTFRSDHGSMPLVICSRIADYEALNTRLNLQGAVLLQPLTHDQVEEYFKLAGAQLAATYQALKKDDILQELVQLPLMLNVLSLAYKGISVEDFSLEHLSTTEMHHRQLFDFYIQQMFDRMNRTKTEIYPKEKAKRWLAWLSRKMTQQGQSVFLLERMQAKWLETSNQQFFHEICMGITFGLLVLSLSWPIIGPSALILGFFFLFTGARRIEAPVEKVQWSWGMLRSKLWLVIIYVTVFFIQGFPMGMTVLIASIWLSGLKKVELVARTFPNQGTRYSLINGLSVGIPYGVLFGVAPYIILWILGMPTTNLLSGLSGAIPLMVRLSFFCSFYFGVSFVFSHYLLRFILYINDQAPWDYARFLDYAAERIFLRKVGGGYIFVHRLLMEHFAAMYSMDEK